MAICVVYAQYPAGIEVDLALAGSLRSKWAGSRLGEGGWDGG